MKFIKCSRSLAIEKNIFHSFPNLTQKFSFEDLKKIFQPQVRMHYDTQITAQVMKCKLQPWYIPKIVEMYYYTRERFFF